MRKPLLSAIRWAGGARPSPCSPREKSSSRGFNGDSKRRLSGIQRLYSKPTALNTTIAPAAYTAKADRRKMRDPDRLMSRKRKTVTGRYSVDCRVKKANPATAPAQNNGAVNVLLCLMPSRNK
ncbi:MAG: hypothetical protein BWY83_01730 [bacterium ADurb.Bin478]|nr:MAG: hypothetical protein BWY83_01730 [bacterium ADurb.Bin478]